MAVVRCEKGHFYDDEKYPDCPHCGGDLPANPRRGLGDEMTVFGGALSSPPPAARPKMHVDMGAMSGVQDEKTVGIFRTEKGRDPVVGWLVCTGGRELGRDFRLHAGRNYIGRAVKSDVALVDDERVSRDDHCSIVYEPRKSSFHLVRGEGEEVLVNGQRLQDSLQLAGDEEIEIGGSLFVFVPFCKEGRTW